ncbi:MAG: mechanosensitive ion channel family protein [Fibrobacteria bacterium]
MPRLSETISRFMELRFLGNSVGEILTTTLFILISMALVRLFQIFLIKRLKRIFAATATTWDDLLLRILESNVIPSLYVILIWLGLRDFHMKQSIRNVAGTVAIVAVTLMAIRIVLAVVKHAIHKYWQRHAADRTAAREKNLNGIVTMVQIVVWILGIILLLDNLGIKVSTFVAGLGITGIAVALAGQAILGDLFSFFVIFFDQPFEVGHNIKVDNFQGDVEHIGLKTTRLRSGDGEQIIFSNKNLTDSRVQNFRRMHRRRVVFALDLDRAAPQAALRALPDLIKAQYARFSDVTFERCHFRQFAETGLRFEIAYVLETPDFSRHLAVQHESNLGIWEDLEKAGIRLAVPAHTVRIQPDPGGLRA